MKRMNLKVLIQLLFVQLLDFEKKLATVSVLGCATGVETNEAACC